MTAGVWRFGKESARSLAWAVHSPKLQAAGQIGTARRLNKGELLQIKVLESSDANSG